jgi:hypothetical protein
MKKYIQNWKKIYKFEEFGDYDNFFIELCYVTNKRDFKSELFAPLTNKVAQNGKSIFANENIDFTKYVLLNERIEEQTNDLMFVYETYGYAPTETYVNYTAEPVTYFGVVDPAGARQSNITNMSFVDATQRQIKVELPTEDLAYFGLGDVVTFHRPFSQVGMSQQYALKSGDCVIIEKTSDAVIVYTFTFMNANTGAVVSQNPIQIFNSSYIKPHIKKSASNRLPQTKISTITNTTSFFTTFPEVESKFVVSSGEGEVDTITSGTIPNVESWKQMIANGEYINVQDSLVDAVYPKTFYKKTQKKVLAK